MLLRTMRLAPLLLLACQGSSEYAQEEVSISPRLAPESTPAEPAAPAPAATAQANRTGPRTGPATTPGAAYGGAAFGQDGLSLTGSPISTGLVPLSAQQDPDSPRFVKRSDRYEVQAGDGKDRFTWVIQPASGGRILDVVTIEDDGGEVRPFAGAASAGVGKPRILDQRRVGDSLEVTYDNDLVQVFTPVGRSLRIDFVRGGGLKRGRLEFLTGGVVASGRAELLDVLRVPFFDIGCVAALEVDRELRYLTSWVDPMASNASQIVTANPDEPVEGGAQAYAQDTRYLEGTHGRRRPLRESLWVTWGTELEEVLPSMDRPASPARERLGEHYYVSFTNTPFRDATEDIEALYGMGLEDIQLWVHHWMRDGYDEGYPDQTFPPRREWGGLPGLQHMSRRVAALGFGMGLHHNWCFNSVRTPGNTMLDSEGRKRATVDGGQYLKHRAALELVDQVEGRFHEEIGTRGTFSDSISIGFPTIDMDSDEEDWGLVRGTLAAYLEIIERLRTIHGSPSAGEGSLGGGNVLFAGSMDAMPGTLFIATQPRATGRNGIHVDILPHFALGRLHELSVRAGVGPPRRFLSPSRWTMSSGFSPAQRDLTQTITALLGNAGFHWWYQLTREGSVARDWWSSREVNLALAAPGIELTELTYYDDRGRGRDLEQHLLAGGELSIGAVRVRLAYASGAELWANLTDEPWKPKGEDETIAPMGHLFRHGEVTAGILTRDGATVQVSSGPERRWLDGRGRATTDGGMSTDGAFGVLRLDASDGGGWQAFPIPDYTLALPSVRDEKVVTTGYFQLGAPLLTPGPHQLIYLDENRLETHGEEVEVGPEGLRLTLADMQRHDASSVRVQPLD